MCRVLGVSRSGYYAWAARGPSTRAVADLVLTGRIREIHCESDGTYGSRRVHAQLRREGVAVNKKRVERLMRVGEIVGAHVPSRRRRSDASGLLGVEGVKAWPDLVERDFTPSAPNELWCADMKQIPTAEGVLHLASVLDCFSRRVVGWRMSGVADEPLVAGAVRAAVAQRRPGEGLIHHSDRGCQGGFNRWSQRSVKERCDGQAGWVDVGVDGSGAVEVAGSAVAAAGCRAAVLAGDREWVEQRGRCACCGGVVGCWQPVVPRAWRHANVHAGPVVGAISVV
jgi:putative transposase